jgi:hypothetical protein
MQCATAAKGMNANRFGSNPRSIDTSRIAPAMRLLATRKIASAAASASDPADPDMLKNRRLGRFDIKALKLSANRIIRVNPAQYHIGISDRWARIAEAIGDRPRVDPALSGPMLSNPPLSTQAIEPPPAPIVVISIMGLRTTIPKSMEVCGDSMLCPWQSAQHQKTCHPCHL